MTYLLKRRETRINNGTKKYKTIIIIFCLAIILTPIFYFWSSVISPSLLRVLVPVSSTFRKTGSNLNLAFNIFKPKSSIIKENEILKNKIAELENKLFDYYIIKDENVTLRGEIGNLDNRFTLAKVLLMPPQLPYDSLLIDKGQDSGVFVGAKVFVSERSAVGYVEEVSRRSSKVRMFTSAGIKTSAILEKDGTQVELEGRGGGNFFLEAPLGFDIDEGDSFLLPGSEKVIIAITGAVREQNSSSFKSVLLRMPIKINGSLPLLVEVNN